MSANERRAELMRILIARRQDTMPNLAAELGVNVRTIQRDVLALTEDYPLITAQGNGGGVKLEDGYYPHKNILSRDQMKVLAALMQKADAYQKEVEEAQADAVWLDEQIKEYLNGENPELGIWYDVEDVSMETADITELCRAFICKLTDVGYTYVGIYSSYNWLTNGNIAVDQLPADIPYWVAQYNSQDDFSLEHPDKAVKMWQYTDHISDDLPYDGNLYYE